MPVYEYISSQYCIVNYNSKLALIGIMAYLWGENGNKYLNEKCWGSFTCHCEFVCVFFHHSRDWVECLAGVRATVRSFGLFNNIDWLTEVHHCIVEFPCVYTGGDRIRRTGNLYRLFKLHRILSINLHFLWTVWEISERLAQLGRSHLH